MNHIQLSQTEAQQILDALEMWVDEEAPHCDLGVLDAKLKAAITRLQSRLAEGEQEPVRYLHKTDGSTVTVREWSGYLASQDQYIPLYAALQGLCVGEWG